MDDKKGNGGFFSENDCPCLAPSSAPCLLVLVVTLAVQVLWSCLLFFGFFFFSFEGFKTWFACSLWNIWAWECLVCVVQKQSLGGLEVWGFYDGTPQIWLTKMFLSVPQIPLNQSSVMDDIEKWLSLEEEVSMSHSLTVADKYCLSFVWSIHFWGVGTRFNKTTHWLNIKRKPHLIFYYYYYGLV